ncbi:MAG TPA: hypothetical protein VHJ34_03015 [Actinomycetota bacterium]|nr:hypothetical protein [Actinomycetota bacterium]
MDLDRLSRGERIALIASALLFVAFFVPMWASISAGGFGADFNGWDGYGILGKLALLCTLAVLVLTALRLTDVALPDMPVSRGLLLLGLSGVATLMLLLGLLVGPNDNGADGVQGVDVDRGLMLFVGIVLAAAMTYGSYLTMQEEGTAPIGGSARPASPPPPPA